MPVRPVCQGRKERREQRGRRDPKVSRVRPGLWELLARRVCRVRRVLRAQPGLKAFRVRSDQRGRRVRREYKARRVQMG